MSSITRIRNKNKSAIPTREESLALVRNLLRTAISSIVYLRNIFPEYCFRDRTLTGINIKALIPEVEDAKLLITWLEKGVFDALEKKYLQSIIFGVYTDPEKETELVESYNFVISYDKDGHSVDVQGSNVGGGDNFSAPAKITKDEIKQSTLTMMRHLTILSQTLEPLPTTRFLTLKLLYHPHTPESYEPPFFKYADPNDPLRFKMKPTKIKVGTVATPYHHLSLKVKTTGGAFDAESDTSSIASSFPAEDDSQPQWSEEGRNQNAKEYEAMLPLVRSVVTKKKCYTLAALSKEFPHISPSELEVYIRELKKIGVIPPQEPKKEDEISTLGSELIDLLEGEYTVSLASIRKILSVGKPKALLLMKHLEAKGIVAKSSQKVKKIIQPSKEHQEEEEGEEEEEEAVGFGLGKRKRVSARQMAKKKNAKDKQKDKQKTSQKKNRSGEPPRKKCSIAREPIVQEE